METRLRVVHMPADPKDTEGTVPFDSETGALGEEWHDGIVVLLGNECARDHVTIFNGGESFFYDSDGPFTPRVEDWSDSVVRVLLDTKGE